MLSYVSIIQLIKSVLQSMLIYSITIYFWPVSLLKNLDSMFRNFTWSGDLDGNKLATVSWKIICNPISFWGLSLRSLTQLNEASNLKLWWELYNFNDQWAIFLRSRVLREESHIRYHIYSLIWSSMKVHFNTILSNSKWHIGNGKYVKFWNDDCIEVRAHFYFFNIPSHISKNLNSKVQDHIINSSWQLPRGLKSFFPNL